jgi:hypothetical protein
MGKGKGGLRGNQDTARLTRPCIAPPTVVGAGGQGEEGVGEAAVA